LIETAIRLPKSQDDLRAIWKLQIGHLTLERMARGELCCLLCEEPIAVDPPPIVGFLKPDDPHPELCGFSVCKSCVLAAEDPEELRTMVGAAYGGTIGPDPSYN
jgi:hypothetical protein